MADPPSLWAADDERVLNATTFEPIPDWSLEAMDMEFNAPGPGVASAGTVRSTPGTRTHGHPYRRPTRRHRPRGSQSQAQMAASVDARFPVLSPGVPLEEGLIRREDLLFRAVDNPTNEAIIEAYEQASPQAVADPVPEDDDGVSTGLLDDWIPAGNRFASLADDDCAPARAPPVISPLVARVDDALVYRDAGYGGALKHPRVFLQCDVNAVYHGPQAVAAHARFIHGGVWEMDATRSGWPNGFPLTPEELRDGLENIAKFPGTTATRRKLGLLGHMFVASTRMVPHIVDVTTALALQKSFPEVKPNSFNTSVDHFTTYTIARWTSAFAAPGTSGFRPGMAMDTAFRQYTPCIYAQCIFEHLSPYVRQPDGTLVFAAPDAQRFFAIWFVRLVACPHALLELIAKHNARHPESPLAHNTNVPVTLRRLILDPRQIIREATLLYLFLQNGFTVELLSTLYPWALRYIDHMLRNATDDLEMWIRIDNDRLRCIRQYGEPQVHDSFNTWIVLSPHDEEHILGIVEGEAYAPRKEDRLDRFALQKQDWVLFGEHPMFRHCRRETYDAEMAELTSARESSHDDISGPFQELSIPGRNLGGCSPVLGYPRQSHQHNISLVVRLSTSHLLICLDDSITVIEEQLARLRLHTVEHELNNEPVAMLGDEQLLQTGEGRDALFKNG
ncbi:hypothetical protein BDZ89DRAFT_1233222 [Hymenopellis radicata]|nr:hypothetical protein BDZ89DRAFT_1233222 [Hymenopellis radicata]